MDKNEIVENINYIKDVISSSTEYTNLSGKASILSGTAAVAGYFATEYFCGKKDLFTQEISILHPFIIIWFGVFFVAVSTNIAFMMKKAKRTGQPAWSRLAKMIVDAMCPSLLAGALLTLFFIREQQLQWIPVTWMGMYGLGVWCASLFSIKAVRILGTAFIVTAVICLFLQYNTIITLAISFGGYHIVYGAWLCYKYGD